LYAFPKELKFTIRSKLSFFFDRICYENSDKIITKGSEGELKYLEVIYKIYNKPHFAFNFLIEQKDLEEKINTELNFDDIKLVFIGGVFSSKDGDNNYDVFMELLQNKNITLHVYSHSSPETLNGLKGINNLIIHPYIKDHKELIKEISKYDFGISISDPFKHEFIQAKMASGMRIYDYLAAGLPIIVDEKHELQAKIIKDNDFGILIPRHDIKNIITWIKKYNYKNLIESVKKNREKYFTEKNANKVINFLNI
jgi:hypothetical protein